MLYAIGMMVLVGGWFALRMWGDRLNNGGRPGRLERFFDEP